MSENQGPRWLNLEDGSRFPRPILESDDYYGPAHMVIHKGAQALTREEAIWLASCASAFEYLVDNPSIARYKLPMIRRALMAELEQQ